MFVTEREIGSPSRRRDHRMTLSSVLAVQRKTDGERTKTMFGRRPIWPSASFATVRPGVSGQPVSKNGGVCGAMIRRARFAGLRIVREQAPLGVEGERRRS